MGIIKNYHDKKWTLQFLDVLYNSIDIISTIFISMIHFLKIYCQYSLDNYFQMFYTFKLLEIFSTKSSYNFPQLYMCYMQFVHFSRNFFIVNLPSHTNTIILASYIHNNFKVFQLFRTNIYVLLTNYNYKFAIY
jgi:hypothetical protein